MTSTVTPQKTGAARRKLREAERNLTYVLSDDTLPVWLREAVRIRAETARAELREVAA
jgi:hypothetical protein